MSKLGEEPAYPFSKEETEGGMDIGGYAIEKTVLKQHQGLTKREWFAGMAMQGLVDADLIYNENGISTGNAKATAIDAITIADEMLAALEIHGEEKKTNLIDAEELRKKIMEKGPVVVNDPYSHGVDYGLCFALDEIDRMMGKR